MPQIPLDEKEREHGFSNPAAEMGEMFDVEKEILNHVADGFWLYRRPSHHQRTFRQLLHEYICKQDTMPIFGVILRGGGGLLTETSAFSVLSSLSFHGFIHNSLSLLKCLFLSLFPDEMSRSISYWRLNDWVGLLFACHSPSLATHSDFCRDEIWFILWGCVTLCTEMKQRCWLCVAWMKLLSVDSSLVFLCVTSSELMPSTHCLYVLALVKKLLLAGKLVYCDTTATS